MDESHLPRMWQQSLSRMHGLSNSALTEYHRPQTQGPARRMNTPASKETFLQTATTYKPRPRPDNFEVAHLSFDAHFKRKTKAVWDQENREWKNLNRIRQVLLNRSKITNRYRRSQIDRGTVDQIVEERREVGKPVGRIKLKPERSSAMAERPRVFFWG